MADTDDLDAQIQAALQRVHHHGHNALHSGDLDDLSVKEVRLKALQQADQVMANDQQASILSVVVYVAVT